MSISRSRRAEMISTTVALASTAAASVTIAVAARWGSDWPAQQFRAWVGATDGFSTWTSQWYGGHPLWGYSVLYPAVAGLIGAAGTGVVAVLIAAAFGMGLHPGGVGQTRLVLFRVGLVLTLLECLLIGQVPFLLGVAAASAAMFCTVNAVRVCWIALAALGTSLASPLVGIFLIIAIPALAAMVGCRRCCWLLPALAGSVASALAGGASGPDPFTAWQLVQVLAFCALLVVLRPVSRPVRYFAGAFALASAMAFAVPNPVGGNVLRLGLLAALPLFVLLVPAATGPLRRAVAVLLVCAAAVWPAQPVSSAISFGATDPSRTSGFYTGLLQFLHTQNPLAGRLEIPFTRGHWEAQYVAEHFPIARGWERQSDLLYNAILYRPLTAQTYRTWLEDNAVSLVALPTEAMDRGGEAERDLLRTPPAYLTRVWSDAHWTVWRVVGARGLVTGAAQSMSVSAATVTLDFLRAGQALVRVRYSPWWQVVAGEACTQAAEGGWMTVVAERAGIVRLQARLSGDLIVADGPCDN